MKRRNFIKSSVGLLGFFPFFSRAMVEEFA